MAFVIARPHGRFEIRESRHTPAGPRARTLATFRELTPEVLSKARARAHGDFDTERIRARAAELKVPERTPNAALTARTLLRELRAGRALPPGLVHELRRVLPEAGPIPETIGDATMWIDADDVARGRALYDLLDLGSYLPIPSRPLRSAFPRLSSEQ